MRYKENKLEVNGSGAAGSPQASPRIRAELEGSHRCLALGLSVDSYTSVCALARLLIRAGYEPDSLLEVYRGTTLCFRVRLGVAARLTVRDGKDGRPRFEKYVPFPAARVTPSIAPDDVGLIRHPTAPENALYGGAQ